MPVRAMRSALVVAVAPVAAAAAAAALAGALICAGCAAPTQPGPTPQSQPMSTLGRWSGSFTAENQQSGGSVRLTVAADGSVNGSLVDSVWQRIHGTARTGLLTGTIAGGGAQVSIAWSSGQNDTFDGTARGLSMGSLGINLTKLGPDGNFAKGGGVALALHEAGVAAQGPYGQPATAPVNFMTQWIGSWTANFSERSGNGGTGTITIAADGSVRGVLVDDAWSDPTPGHPLRQATLAGAIDASGMLALEVQWGSQPGVDVSGKGYFEQPETAVFQLGPSHEAVIAQGPTLTLTIGRN